MLPVLEMGVQCYRVERMQSTSTLAQVLTWSQARPPMADLVVTGLLITCYADPDCGVFPLALPPLSQSSVVAVLTLSEEASLWASSPSAKECPCQLCSCSAE